ncbi:hypothetical protein X751_16595 [Mesorhizobium sp. LNJC395A00]|nr:hypothetical protein X751_16595 [Mesorhizobium sp. LNJC395A00]
MLRPIRIISGDHTRHDDPTLPLSGLSSVGGKSVVARFDGGMLSSDSGVLALAEVEKRLRVADRLARCIDDPRSPDQVIHNFTDMIGFRMKMIAAGYEDGNDANRLRSDPVFKMAQDAPPSGRDLASQSTMCRLENLPDVRSLLAMGRTMVDLYCASFRQIPKRIVLDIDDTFDAVHGTSSSASSMPITTSTASSRLLCSTATAGSWLLSCDRPSGQVGRRERRRRNTSAYLLELLKRKSPKLAASGTGQQNRPHRLENDGDRRTLSKKYCVGGVGLCSIRNQSVMVSWEATALI